MISYLFLQELAVMRSRIHILQDENSSLSEQVQSLQRMRQKDEHEIIQSRNSLQHQVEHIKFDYEEVIK